jgi:pimeloyl-ACP methyl ester carboxylesterase
MILRFWNKPKGMQMEPEIAKPGAEEYRAELSVMGRRIAYYDRGHGVPLVLVHGLFGDYMDWAPVLEPLAAHFRVIAVDLPGFGDSQRLDGEGSPEKYVAALEAFFAALDLHGIALAGNSFGGMVCSFYAAAHPERLRSLVLVSSAGMKEYSAEEQALVTEHFNVRNLLALRPEYIESMFAINFAQRTPQREAYLERQRGKLARPDYAEYAQVLTECALMAFAHPVVPLLERLEIPVPLVWGADDLVFPIALAHAALERVARAKLVTIAGASHMPQMDQPEQFVRIAGEHFE